MRWAGCRSSEKFVMSGGRRAGGEESGSSAHQPPPCLPRLPEDFDLGRNSTAGAGGLHQGRDGADSHNSRSWWCWVETAEGLGAREERCRNSGERCRPWTRVGGGGGGGSHQINFTKTWALAAKGPPEMSGADGTVVSQTGTVGTREGQGSALVSLQAGPTGAPWTQDPGTWRRTVSAPGPWSGVAGAGQG